jgi:hypothetical protein
VKSLKNKKYWGHLEKEIMNKLDPGEDYLPYAVEPKNLDSNFDGRFSFKDTKNILLIGKFIAYGMKDDGYVVITCNSDTFYLYNKYKDEFGLKVDFDDFKDYSPWSIIPLPSKYDMPSKKKHIGSSFDNFLKTNNIELKRDINWALKMLDHDKIVYRESNPKVIIYPKSSNISNLNLKISAEDLFAEDWLVFDGKSFKDILEDLYAGKTIRRKGWHDLLNIGKYGPNKILSVDDLYANDWEIVDIVAEVDEIQKNIKENRFEDK